jgi:hypothetical protein
VYVSHATTRSRRKAHQLAMQLWASTPANGSISPLRRTQILVSLHRYFRSINDSEVATECFMECMLTTKQANLFHQQRELLTSMANGLFHVCDRRLRWPGSSALMPRTECARTSAPRESTRRPMT